MSIYRTASITKFDGKNVIYLAYVGVHHGTDLYKYGKSSNVYNREMTAHRKTFQPCFEMRGIYETNYKDQVETLLEKELKIRDLHRSYEINGKRQTELFVSTEEYDFPYIETLVKDIIYDFDCKDANKLKIELEALKIERLKLEITKMKMMKKMSINSKCSTRKTT